VGETSSKHLLIQKLLWKESGRVSRVICFASFHLYKITVLHSDNRIANNINQNHSRSKIKCTSINQSLVGLCHSDEVVRQ